MKISKFNFGKTKAGENVHGIRVDNEKGIEFSAINYGATMTSFKMADRDGKNEECTLGFDNIKDYEEQGAFFGATIGRVGNRIANASYSLDGVTYELSVNDQECNHLHGGKVGFDKVLWNLESFEEEDRAGIKCTYLSKDGEENYPGNLQVEVQYILTSDNKLILQYKAQTDRRTPVNLTNHSYWNFSGNKKENVHTHKVQIKAQSYLPTDHVSIPTGEKKSVCGTPFDFRELKELGPAIQKSGGFDHNFNLSDEKKSEPVNTMYVEHRESGRTMKIETTEPGVQFYTGNFLHMLKEKGFDKHEALCLETQMYPDSVNHGEFPSIILNPGEVYRQTTIHSFGIKK